MIMILLIAIMVTIILTEGGSEGMGGILGAIWWWNLDGWGTCLDIKSYCGSLLREEWGWDIPGKREIACSLAS